MKLYLIKMPPFGLNSDELFTINKWYDGDLTPQKVQEIQNIFNPTTFKFFYVVKCNDGFIRKVDAEYFITQEEWRERQLNELGI